MSKLSKFFLSPRMFWLDFFQNRHLPPPPQNKTIFAFHINDWKRSFIESLFPEYNFVYIPFKATDEWFTKHLIPKLIDPTYNHQYVFLIWGMWLPKILQQHHFINQNIKKIWVEDGFIRSIALGSNRVLPASLNFDNKTCYFNAKQESDLEHLLSNYDFDSDTVLMERAQRLKERLLKNNISKYNHAETVNIESIYGEKTKKRVLVIGQVEDDASIIYGCSAPYNNNDLVRIAAYENPNAQIIYKPHPDVLHKKRQELSNPEEVADICQILRVDVPLAQSFATIDHVYTISSQSGFEALLRDIKVTTLGCPFYANWGCTDNRQENHRRTRKLTVNQILAAAYILYPRYYHPLYKRETTIEDILDYFETVLARK